MRKLLPKLFFLSAVFFLLTNCRKKDWDEYYGRPDNLAPPIYQQLQSKGNFTNILAIIDKAGYRDILGTAGYWTFFAPNDEAFKTYFQQKGISGVDQIDSATANQIATYCLVLNAYRKDQLTASQTSKGPVPNTAFRRKTAYYDFGFSEPAHRGIIFSNNRNAAYVANDNNNKYIPYFIDSYLNANGLSAGDYTSFFPGAVYNGFNVAGARVVNADIPAENGLIHEIDKVITPLQSIEQYIASNPNYSEFKKLLDKTAFYTQNAALTKRYFAVTGKDSAVYIKQYNTNLAFSPGNEGYLNQVFTDGQAQSWTMVVPTNQALKDYTAALLENLGTFEAAPAQVLYDLINSHMWTSTVWPQGLPIATNSQGQTPTFQESNIVDRKVLSNGIFYGTNAVQDANVFRTIYGKAYLNPNFGLTTRIFNTTDLKVALTNPRIRYTAFLSSDVELKKVGYDFSVDSALWTFKGVPDASSSTKDKLARIIQTSVVYTPKDEFNDLSGEGIAEGFNGEYVKFKNGRVMASGNVVKGNYVTVTGYKDAFNGRVYYTSGTLEYAENTETLGQSIERLALSTDPNVSSKFSYFYQYLINSNTLWNSTTKDIIGAPVGAFYTVFIPTNAAISQAVKDGLLPGDKVTGVPGVLATQQTPTEQFKVANFILYHILEKNTIAVDGKKYGSFASLLKDSEGNARLVTVYYPGLDPTNYVASQMELRDDFYAPSATPPVLGATVNVPFSNNLANRALIHSINKVLNFNVR